MRATSSPHWSSTYHPMATSSRRLILSYGVDSHPWMVVAVVVVMFAIVVMWRRR